MPHVPSPLRLNEHRSALLVIDLQEKLCPVIPAATTVETEVRRLVDAAVQMSIPAAATVQYPRGLGTFDSHHCAKSISRILKKNSISRQPSVVSQLMAWLQAGRDQIVIAGIETHICILQTVLDLLAEGIRPICCGSSSRSASCA